jgi:biopolymer transport protein ExbB/TolQ
MENSIWDLMSHGGGAMWVVVAFSVIALAVGIERAIAQWKFVTRARMLGDTVTRCLARGALEESRSACERSPSPIADVFLVGYERLGRAKPEHVATAVHRERLRVNQDLKARLWMLGTIGATAPFVGLFGTVVGIIVAMGGFKGDETVKFNMVSGPISSQRANRVAVELKLLTDEFLELLLDTPGDSGDAQRRRSKRDSEANAAIESTDRKETKRTKGDDDGDREAAA